MKMSEIYENERVYSKIYNIGELERMYNDAYEIIKEKRNYVPEIERFELIESKDCYAEIEYKYDEYGNELSCEEVEKYSTRYQLNFYNKIRITQDEDGGIYVDVMTEEHISGYDRYLKHQRKRG